jgi:TolA-binding protein
MVGVTIPPQLLPAMIRSASVPVVVVAFALGVMPASAQDSSELLTRIERLEASIRTLTGTVEELQYRNQQLEQQVQRLLGGAPAASAAPPQRPTAQLPPPAAAVPPAVVAAPAPAPVEPPVTGMRRGDAFDPHGGDRAAATGLRRAGSGRSSAWRAARSVATAR